MGVDKARADAAATDDDSVHALIQRPTPTTERRTTLLVTLVDGTLHLDGAPVSQSNSHRAKPRRGSFSDPIYEAALPIVEQAERLAMERDKTPNVEALLTRASESDVGTGQAPLPTQPAAKPAVQ